MITKYMWEVENNNLRLIRSLGSFDKFSIFRSYPIGLTFCSINFIEYVNNVYFD